LPTLCTEESDEALKPPGKGVGKSIIRLESLFQPQAIDDKGSLRPVVPGVYVTHQTVAIEDGHGIGTVDAFFERLVDLPYIVEIKKFERPRRCSAAEINLEVTDLTFDYDNYLLTIIQIDNRLQQIIFPLKAEAQFFADADHAQVGVQHIGNNAVDPFITADLQQAR